ncbi:MAG: efflux RND transporter periplasmic adaptor subunit [Bacteroidia bacterium]
MKRIFFYVGIVAAFLVIFWGICSRRKTLTVEVAPVGARQVTAYITETAKLRPRIEVPLSADVSGEVIEIFVKEGDTVRRGQLLLTVRPDNYKTALDQAQASLYIAQAEASALSAGLLQQRANLLQDSTNLARSMQLYAQRAIALTELESARLRYEISRAQYLSTQKNLEAARFRIQSAQAALRQAAQNLQRTSIYASMDGIVTRLPIKVGQRVVGTSQMQGTEVLRIADLSQMIAELQISEADIQKIHVGDTAEISVEAYPELRLHGRVIEIGYAPATLGTASTSLSTDQIVNYPVKIEIDTARYNWRRYILRPEMTALVKIYYARRTAPSVLVSAVRADSQEKLFFFDSTTQRVYLRPIKTGISDGYWITVDSGAQAGEAYVQGPYELIQTTLRDSQKVKPLWKLGS